MGRGTSEILKFLFGVSGKILKKVEGSTTAPAHRARDVTAGQPRPTPPYTQKCGFPFWERGVWLGVIV